MTEKAISPLRQRMIEDMTIRKFAPKTHAAGRLNFFGGHVALADLRASETCGVIQLSSVTGSALAQSKNFQVYCGKCISALNRTVRSRCCYGKVFHLSFGYWTY